MNEKKETSIVKAVESAAIAVTPSTVKAYINALATEQEIALFLNQCAMFGLNPFKREIYLIKYSQKDPATFVTGYEVYLKRADRTEKWGGMESGTVDDAEGRPIKAWAKIFRKDWKNPLCHEVDFSEYCQFKTEWKDGKAVGKVPTRFWAEKPKTMLKKVAIAQALRMAFPDEFGGMPYTAEEMPVDHTKLPTAEITATDAASPTTVDKYSGVKPAEAHPAPAPVHDEFTGPGAFDQNEEPKKPKAAGCPLDLLSEIAKRIANLRLLGLEEGKIYASMAKKVREKYGAEFVELGELTPEMAKDCLAYLTRWEKAVKAEDAAKAAAGETR